MNIKLWSFASVLLVACGQGETTRTIEQGNSPDAIPANNQTQTAPTKTPATESTDTTAPACVPTTCEAMGYTCGSYTTCGEVKQCGTCSGDNYCNNDVVGTCQPFAQLCPSASLTVLGTCTHNNTTTFAESTPSGLCYIYYPFAEVEEYQDTNTLTAATTKEACEALDVATPYTCSNNASTSLHTYVWSSTLPQTHSGKVGCHITGYATNTCSDTVVWYDPNVDASDPATRCAATHGTLLNSQ